MEQLTLRVSQDTKESLQDEADDRDQTLSEYMRDLINARNEDTVAEEEYESLRDEHESLQSDHDRLRDEVERLRREKRQILDQREENKRLQRYVEHDREWHEAALLTRLKWYVRGKD